MVRLHVFRGNVACFAKDTSK